jgi:hypothetical protein
MHVMISTPVLLALLVAVISACNAQPDDRVPTDTTSRTATTQTPPPATERLPLLDSGAPALLPRDEADASFRSFRTTTLAALSARDTTYLYSILAADIKNSFGGDDSIAFEHVAVVTANAAVRDEASRAAMPIGRLSHSILKIEDWHNLGQSGAATDSTWARVRLPGGRSAWVRGLDVYSPVSWRAFFVRRNGRWILQLFVAGD